jgi:CHAD domain-containing protein
MTGGAMAFHFKDTATVQDTVREIATDLIDDAIDVARKNHDSDKTVHHLRRNCKKLRGLIRLVRPVFADYRAENAIFRDAARELSVLRDGAILIATYDRLLDAGEDQVDRARFAPIRRRLTLQQKKALAKHANIGARLEQFAQTMSAARKRARQWQLDADGFDALRGGIAKSYKGARRAMAETSREPSAEAVHEWRKRIKDHWYHARLLTPIFPTLMKAHRDVADDLGELLGRHHDLDVFRQRLNGDKLVNAADRGVLTGLLRRRQKALEDEAFLLGAHLLAEPASDLAARWESYWNTWRTDRPRDAALAA